MRTARAERFDEAKSKAIELHSAQAGEFDSHYQALEQGRVFESCFGYSRSRLDELLERLLPSDGARRRLLDVGCGTGPHLGRFGVRGYEVFGVDGSPSMVARARANNPGVDVREADVDALPYPGKSFDVVMCVEVLRYVPGTSRCIAEIARVLRPGGIALVTATPPLNLNGYWLVNQIAARFRPRRLVTLRQYFASPSRLRREFRSAGFDRVDVHGVYLGPINWVERLAPALLPGLLRAWQRFDRQLADRPVLRGVANMVLVHAQKGDKRRA